MKKYMIIGLIGLAMNSFSSRVVTDNNYFSDLFSDSGKIDSFIKGSYNKETDIAVVSNSSSRELEGLNDAEKGLKSAIAKYAYGELQKYLKSTNLVGPGFNDAKMSDFSKDISEQILYNRQNYITTLSFFDRANNKYYILVKVEKRDIDRKVKETFKERLKIVISTLKELEEGIKID